MEILAHKSGEIQKLRKSKIKEVSNGKLTEFM